MYKPTKIGTLNHKNSFIQSKRSLLIIIIVLIFSTLLFLFYLNLTNKRIYNHIGAFTYPDLSISLIEKSSDFNYFNRIHSINNIPIKDYESYQKNISSLMIGEPVSVIIQHDNQLYERIVRVDVLVPQKYLAYIIISIFICALLLYITAKYYFSNPNNNTFVFLLTTFFYSSLFLPYFPEHSLEIVYYLKLILGSLFLGCGFLLIGLNTPISGKWFVIRTLLSFGITFIPAFLILFFQYHYAGYTGYIGLFFLLIGSGLFRIYQLKRKENSVLVQKRYNVLMLSLTLFGLISLTILSMVFLEYNPFWIYLILPLLSLLLFEVMIHLFEQRLFNLLSYGGILLFYILSSIILGILLFAVHYLISLYFPAELLYDFYFLVIYYSSITALILLFAPKLVQLAHRINPDTVYYPEQIIANFGKEITQLSKRDEIVDGLKKQIHKIIGVAENNIILYINDENNRMDPNDPLISYVILHQKPIYIDSQSKEYIEGSRYYPDLLKKGIVLIVPVFYRNQIFSLLGLGLKKNRSLFTETDILLLENITQFTQIAIANALLAEDLRNKNIMLQERSELLEEELKKISEDKQIIGNDPQFKNLLSQIPKVANMKSSVLVLGESGTGKELIARLIHDMSDRADKAYITLNCAALPENLLENELFGHERGAYTGADTQGKGRFELAHKGTLFLDEIGEMPLSLQPKVLRVIQEQEFQRLGGEETITVDVRLIFATHQDLEKKVAEGTFRADLFYRINIIPLHIPPLRQRKNDIPLLIAHFMKVYCKQNNLPLKTITPECVKILQNYHWKGNVRELQNVIQQMTILTEGNKLDINSIPSYITEESEQSLNLPQDARKSLRDLVRDYEKKIIIKTLIDNNYVVSQAAKKLRISRGSLRYKMTEYNILQEDGTKN